MWKKFGEPYDWENNPDWDSIVSYMDDVTREIVHFEYAPCTKETFITEYLKRDPVFEEEILEREFGIRR